MKSFKAIINFQKKKKKQTPTCETMSGSLVGFKETDICLGLVQAVKCFSQGCSSRAHGYASELMEMLRISHASAGSL